MTVVGGAVPRSPPLCSVNGGRPVSWRAQAGVEHGARASGEDGVVLRARARPGGAGARASQRAGRWPWRGAGQVAVARHGLTRRARVCGRTARGRRNVACARGGGLPSSARGEGTGAALAGSERDRERKGGGAQVNRSGAGRAGRGSAVGPRGRGGGKERKKGEKEKEKGRKKWKRGKRKGKKGERERRRERESGIRGVTGARSATYGAWARVNATRRTREEQGAGYGCRVRSFGDQQIGTGRFPESWG